jgi:UPF0042 nucleotide-binding protein
LVIITGISGSGKSTALNAFEDLGFNCIDNLPGALTSGFVDFLLSGEGASAKGDVKFALLVDCRDQRSFTSLRESIERLKGEGVDVSLLFFDCQDEVIVRRFRETRRPHPLLRSETLLQTIGQALEAERELLADLKEAADRVLDTSAYTPHDLRRLIEAYCDHQGSLHVFLETFGFKYGVPHDVDLMIDVRFLPNPHFVEELRPLTGEDKRVYDYVISQADAQTVLEKYGNLLEFLLPKYIEEGKRYLTIGIGCTGGRHRSVAIARALESQLGDKDYDVSVIHRDSGR